MTVFQLCDWQMPIGPILLICIVPVARNQTLNILKDRGHFSELFQGCPNLTLTSNGLGVRGILVLRSCTPREPADVCFNDCQSLAVLSHPTKNEKLHRRTFSSKL
jgi:hypothetical protein